jgi:hypothetical protein
MLIGINFTINLMDSRLNTIMQIDAITTNIEYVIK